MVKMKHSEKSFEQRQTESTKIMEKYTDRVCIYIEKSNCEEEVPSLDKNKYLVPNYLSIAQFIYVIRNRIRLPKEKALFFYTKNQYLLSGNARMIELYDKYRDADGFFYITYTGENCFGEGETVASLTPST